MNSKSLALSAWGVPDEIVEKYQQSGIHQMFEWQAECLSLPGIMKDRNLIYNAPTSGGKTLVAELLMIKKVMEKRTKAIMVLPFVSLAKQKLTSLQNLLQDSNIRVEGYMGSHVPTGGFSSVDIAVCTIEKANSLINRLLEEGTLGQLGAIVVDELHMIGDSSRGYLLELMLTKIRYVATKDEAVVQIIGMSATIPNMEKLVEWLDATWYKTDFRPVPLKEMVLVEDSLYDCEFNVLKKINKGLALDNENDVLVQLILEVILEGQSVLVFCPTKNWCEKLAESVSREIFRLGRSGPHSAGLQSELRPEGLMETLEHLKRTPSGLDPALAKTVCFGVAFHHAGLTMEERDIVEGSFNNGVLRVLIATSTLSSGVNLPARRVIIRSPYSFQNQMIDPMSYKQMIGRAGRKGIDTKGESILLAKTKDWPTIKQLMKSEFKPLTSCLMHRSDQTASSSMKRAILEVIASGSATSPENVSTYAQCTFLATLMGANTVERTELETCIRFLEDNELICLTTDPTSGVRYIATQLGKACLASSLSPDEGLKVFLELHRARKCFVLENDLHLLYLVVPIYAAVQWPNLDWGNFLMMWEGLTEDKKRVGELVGVEERFLVRAMRGTLNKQTQAMSLAIHQRFFTALALQDLVNEVSLEEVCRKFGAAKGVLQSLQQTASTFAGMVTSFCHQLGWKNLELLLGQFQDRLQFGITRDLIDLCRLESLNAERARVLYNAGFETVSLLAQADVTDIEVLLMNLGPFESKKQDAKSIWIQGQRGVSGKEAAELIVREARDTLQKDLGVNVSWGVVRKRRRQSIVVPSPKPQQTSASKVKRKGDESVEAVDVSHIEVDNSELDISKQMDLIFSSDCGPVQGESRNEMDIDENKENTQNNSILRGGTTFQDFRSPISRSTPKAVLADRSCPETPMFDSEPLELCLESISESDFECSITEPTKETPVRKQKNSLLRVPMNTEVVMSDSDCDLFGESPLARPSRNRRVETLQEVKALKVIDVCSDKRLYHQFFKEWKDQKDYSLAAAMEKPNGPSSEKPSLMGLAICWGTDATAFYVSLSTKHCSRQLDDTIDAPEDDENISRQERIDDVKRVLECQGSRIVVFDAKEHIKALQKAFGCRFQSQQFADPKVASWMLNPDGKEDTLATLVLSHAPDVSTLLRTLGSAPGCGSVALNPEGQSAGRARAVAEAVLTARVMWKLEDILMEKGLSASFSQVEMPTVPVLAQLELTGIGFDEDEFLRQRKRFLALLDELERTAHRLAGRRFSLTSRNDLAQILYKELRLPINGEPGKMGNNGRLHVQVKKSALSVSKEVLQKLEKYHKLPGIILCFRKINMALMKTINPILQERSPSSNLGPPRIFPRTQFFTATGRVSFHEPNLQNVPKEFEIETLDSNNEVTKERTVIGLRNAFIAPKGRLLLGADYSQVELRILAHLSHDKNLQAVLNSSQDVFRQIASEWKKCPLESVSESQRQQAKQICYGMIYGIGSKALSDQLAVDEPTGEEFLRTFRATYPVITSYVSSVVQSCLKSGFVRTILGRQRHLPDISSPNPFVRSHAERQAVNTSIQGSAADLVKTAMVRIEERVARMENRPWLVLQLHDELLYEVAEENLDEVLEIVTHEMETAMKLDVKLPVKVKVGHMWGSMESR